MLVWRASTCAILDSARNSALPILFKWMMEPDMNNAFPFFGRVIGEFISQHTNAIVSHLALLSYDRKTRCYDVLPGTQ